MIKAGILGATGFAGNELVEILLRHPEAEIAFISSASYAGKRYCDTCRSTFEMTLLAPETVPYADADVITSAARRRSRPDPAAQPFQCE